MSWRWGIFLILACWCAATVYAGPKKPAPNCAVGQTAPDLAKNLDSALNLKASTTLKTRLQEKPSLYQMYVTMIEDPAVPRHIQVTLQKAMDEDVSIQDLTRTLRKELGISKDHKAIQFSDTSEKIQKVSPNKMHGTDSPSSKNVNAKLTDDLNDSSDDLAKFTNKHVVLVDTGNPEENALINLAHELAHIRFDLFMEQNIAKIAPSFSPELIQKAADGTYKINSDLYVFLEERYAAQVEYDTLRSTAPRYGMKWPKRWGDPRIPPERMKKALGPFTIEDYEISDPKVVALKERSLFDILRNGDLGRPNGAGLGGFQQ